MLLISTSHRPSQRTRSFTKDLASLIPYSARITRGKMRLSDLAAEAYRRGLQYILIVCESRGNPSQLLVYRIEASTGLFQVSRYAVIKLKGVRLSRENPLSTRVYNPRSIGIDYENCTTDLCFTLADLLLAIFFKVLGNQPDVKVVLEDGEAVTMRFYSSVNRQVGPLIKVREVTVYK
ncbi:MAG: ribosomal biogenesis protein [Desulfurococcus sp.]|nr:ribosomal biogenesis protein [Desulfurococcus sp.]